MMKWFKNVTTVEKLRKEYRRLLELYLSYLIIRCDETICS